MESYNNQSADKISAAVKNQQVVYFLITNKIVGLLKQKWLNL